MNWFENLMYNLGLQVENKKWIWALPFIIAIVIGIAVFAFSGADTNDNVTVTESNVNISETEDSLSLMGTPSDALSNENVTSKLSLYEQLESDVVMLKSADADTLKKYFGESKDFNELSKIFRQLTIKNIGGIDKDRVSVRIDTLNFEVVMEDYNNYSKQVRESNANMPDEAIKSYVETRVKQNIEDGRYKVYFELTVEYDEATGSYITGNLKRALTGNWFNSLSCDIESHIVE